MADFTMHRLAAALSGVRYPCRTWELLAWGDYNGVDAEMRQALWALPSGSYPNLASVARALAVTCPWINFVGLPDLPSTPDTPPHPAP